ncbi:MAG: hypothetical protein DME19_01405 [Verrucomicrobia bacterium]|nr:MAG: hypothetical protein DME19_01405 [Verrucomicrobiota bacterium]
MSERRFFGKTGRLPQNVNYAVKTVYLNPLLQEVPELGAKIKHSDKTEVQTLDKVANEALPSVFLVETYR